MPGSKRYCLAPTLPLLSTLEKPMFEIHIFPGDPGRGPDHKGYMYSLHLSDGSYRKSRRGFPTIESAAMLAGIEGARVEEEIACRRS